MCVTMPGLLEPLKSFMASYILITLDPTDNDLHSTREPLKILGMGQGGNKLLATTSRTKSQGQRLKSFPGLGFDTFRSSNLQST